MNKRNPKGTICVFLALVLLLIMSLILVFLESASKAASKSYAQILLKTATGSVMGEYYGPLFADYDIFAIDSGFGTKKSDPKEMERRLNRYMGENVWNYSCEDIRVYDMEKLLDESGTGFMSQAAAYEKYAAVEDVLDEVLSRIKNLGNQKSLTKVMEKRMDIEDKLAVIDKKTLELMKLIDGVNLTLGSKTSSLLGYGIEDWFIKKLFVGENTMTGTGINNPSVYERLKEKYIDPVDLSATYREALKVYAQKLKSIKSEMEKITLLREKSGEYALKIKDTEDSIKLKENRIAELEALRAELALENEENGLDEEAGPKDDEYDDPVNKNANEKEETEEKRVEESETRKTKIKEKEESEKRKNEIEQEILTLQEEIANLSKEVEELDSLMTDILIEIEEISEAIAEKQMEITDISGTLKYVSEYIYNLLYEVRVKLIRVCEITDEVAELQEKVKPMVEDFEDILRTIGPIIGEDLKKEMNDTLDFMKAYVGFGNSKASTTDFDAIKKTAEYDLRLISQIDIEAYRFLHADTYETVIEKLGRMPETDDVYKNFSYSGFTFDYSEIKESSLENKLVEEFENNVSEGYLSMFLPDNVKLSKNSMLSELLPSLWYEVAEDEDGADPDSIMDGADDKGGGELLTEADEGSGLSDIGDMIADGFETMGTKLLSAMYMRNHFKSFRNKSVEGDTVLDYELEYILSGYETDMANLSAAATKIMLLRLTVCTVYTLTQKDMKAQAQALAVSIMGFTGLPFLVTLVKYLILFLWSAAQAVIETAAIMRGKKVPIIPNSESFCLTLAELPLFAGLISEKADNFKESELYLDYDDYLFVMLLLEGEKKQAARAMDIIQENIRYKYNEDFLMNNAVTSFSCNASFNAPYKYLSFMGVMEAGSSYTVEVSDNVAY